MEIEFEKYFLSISQQDLFITILASAMFKKVDLQPKASFLNSKNPPENAYEYYIKHETTINGEPLTIEEELTYVERGSAGSSSYLQYKATLGVCKYLLWDNNDCYRLIIESTNEIEANTKSVLHEVKLHFDRQKENNLIHFWVNQYQTSFSEVYSIKEVKANKIFQYFQENLTDVLKRISFLSYYPISQYKKKSFVESSHIRFENEAHTIDIKLKDFNQPHDKYQGTFIESNFNIIPFSFSLFFFHTSNKDNTVDSVRLIATQEGENFYKKEHRFDELKKDVKYLLDNILEIEKNANG